MGHTFSNLNYHAVFSTKERRRLLAHSWRPQMFAYMGGIVRNCGGALLAMNGVEDHVHTLLSLKPTLRVADVIRDLKSNSSRWIRDSHGGRVFGWQEGYAVFSVSESAKPSVFDYIRRQERHHKRRNYEDELRHLLELHNIPFDRAHFLD